MYEFLMQNSLYTVLIIFVICAAGIFLFLARMSSTVAKLEQRNDQ